MFLSNQTVNQKEDYGKLLSAVGGLSKLFSSNTTPYLYYRAHENIFCLTLDANNESRGDVSVDAIKGTTGVGLKTYLFDNSQFEKVAEFNKLIDHFKSLKGMDLATAISEARNDRIETTKRIYSLDKIIYHCVVRSEGKFKIHEEQMDLININKLIVGSETSKSIKFHDDKNYYNFNFGKSTLFKKFGPDTIQEFDVEIIEDPFSLLLKNEEFNKVRTPEEITTILEDKIISDDRPQIVLPLYTNRGKTRVPERSGLNQWNADGRKRDSNEVYIRIPLWVHRSFKGFFPPKEVPFNLELPGGQVIDAKVCQAGNKALMSNPNSALGEWLLRKVLDRKPGELVTYEKLLNIGIDSVLITKNSENDFEIDFKKVGSYEEFEKKWKVTI